MEQLNDLDYENIENAVMETARGRWFLAEFKKRNAGAGTPKILDAIAKLEKVVREIGNGSQSGPANPASQANATPKADAETSTTKASGNKTVIAPLQHQPDALSDDNLQFFANDEELFADTAPPTPVAKADEPGISTTTFAPLEAKPEKPVNERFKVFRTSDKQETADKSDDAADSPAPAKKAAIEKQAEKEKTPPCATPEIPDPAMTATQDEKDRIVVIRNAAPADIEIPLAGSDIAPETKPADA